MPQPGAMIQCADGISSSLTEVMENESLSAHTHLIVQECLSAAETIQLCAQHQKSIVDEYVSNLFRPLYL